MRKNLFVVLLLAGVGLLFFGHSAEAVDVSGKTYIQYMYDLSEDSISIINTNDPAIIAPALIIRLLY